MSKNKKIVTICIIILFLIVSLSQYIAPIFNRNIIIAKVGKERITNHMFYNEFNRAINYLEELRHSSINLDIINEINLYNAVLENMINDLITKQMIKKYKLKISNDFIAGEIKKSGVFNNSDGEFDREKFELSLKNSNVKLKEIDYINNIQNAMLSLLINSYLGYFNFSFPKIADSMYKNIYQLREIEKFSIPKNTNINISEPTNKQLEKFYNENLFRYIIHEYRSADYAIFDYSEMEIDENVISDSDIKNEIKNNKLDSVYEYQYIKTDNLEDAKNILSSIKTNNDEKRFSDHEKVSNIYTTTLESVDNIALFDYLLYMEFPTISDIVSDGKSFYIINLISIKKISDLELKKLKEETKLKLINEKKQSNIDLAREEFQLLFYENNVEYDLKKFHKILEKYKVKIRKIGPVNIYGKLRNQKSSDYFYNSKTEDKECMLNTLFQTNLNQSSNIVELSDKSIKNSFIVLYVTDIIPQTQKSFNKAILEVKKDFISNYKKEYLENELLKIANKKKSMFDTQVHKNKETIFKPEIAFIENHVKNTLPIELVENIFKINIGEFTDIIEYNNNYILTRLLEIKEYEITNEKKQLVKERILENINDIISQMIQKSTLNFLRNKEFRTKIFDKNFDSIKKLISDNINDNNNL